MERRIEEIEALTKLTQAKKQNQLKFLEKGWRKLTNGRGLIAYWKSKAKSSWDASKKYKKCQIIKVKEVTYSLKGWCKLHGLG